MLEIIKTCSYTGENEDLFFSQACAGVKVKIPSASEAATFSMEHVFSENSVGIHQAWRFHSAERLEVKERACEGIRELQELQTNFKVPSL